MSLFKNLFKKFSKKEEKPLLDEKKELEECPFCWGYQEFGTQSRIIRHDKQIDVKNHVDKNVKVGKFMVEHVDGFKNKRRIVERCPECGGKKIRFVENS